MIAAEHGTNSEIARRLYVSLKTIATHLSHVMPSSDSPAGGPAAGSLKRSPLRPEVRTRSPCVASISPSATSELLRAATRAGSGGRSDHSQSWNALELCRVAGGKAHPVRERGGRYPEVVCADELPPARELGPNVSVNARDLLGDLNCPHASEQMFDECAAASARCAPRAMHAVQELADGDDADRPVLIADRALNIRIGDTALEVDEHVGVDQDSHASSGGPTDSRTARMSRANLESSGGALAINSRNRSAVISLDLGEEITATAAPLRVTSISSPSATLLRTSEKLRAASVAVIRVTGEDNIR
jgi:hypothetical protein